MEEATVEAEDVLTFWFGAQGAYGQPDAVHLERWFKKDAAFDQAIRDRFHSVYEAVAAGEHEVWLETPRGRLAYIIVLDQLSRNMFRDTPKMYAHDGLALKAAVEGIDRGDDGALGPYERTFLYMPLMHAEDLAMQDRCVALFAKLKDEVDGEIRPYFETGLDFAERHRDIVARFGRFPHRNAILGRDSTAEERAFLTEPGSSF